MSQSQADSTKELQVELQQCKEKVTSLEEENHKLDLQGNKVCSNTYTLRAIDLF